MKIHRLFISLVVIFLLALTLFNTIDWLHDQAVHALQEEERKHERISLVINEFVLTSRDLTRYSRVFVKTQFLPRAELFYHILNWSYGKKERPQTYDDRINKLLPRQIMSQLEIAEFLGLAGNEAAIFKAAFDETANLALIDVQAIESLKAEEYVAGPEVMLEGETVQEFADRIVYAVTYRASLIKIEELLEELQKSRYEQLIELRAESQRKTVWLQTFAWIADGVLVLVVSLFLAYFLYHIHQESTDRLRLILDSAPLAMELRDENNNILLGNKKILNLFGTVSQEERCKYSEKLNPKFQPDGKSTHDFMQEAIHEALQMGFALREVTHRNMAGELLTVEATLTCVPYKNQNLVMVTLRDIRDLKALQATASESQARMQILIEAMPFGCMVWDDKGNALDCNQMLVELCGVKDEQECRARFAELAPPVQMGGRRSATMLPEQINAACRARLIRFEWTILSADGEEIPTEMTLVRIVWNQKLSVAGYIRDLREMRAMQQAAEQAHHHAKLMLESMPLRCVMWDIDGHVLGCNRAMYESSGMNSEQEFMQRFAELFPETQPDGRNSQEVAIELVKLACNDGSLRTEFTYLNLAGDLIPSEVHFIRVDWDETQVILSYSRDLREEV